MRLQLKEAIAKAGLDTKAKDFQAIRLYNTAENIFSHICIIDWYKKVGNVYI